MAQIPDEVVSATLINLATRQEQKLSLRADSGCHFADRFSYGDYEIGFRFDWGDLDVNGNPTLDADFFKPGQTKPIREMRNHPSHHTEKVFDPSVPEWTYNFEFQNLKLSCVLRVTRQRGGTIDCLVE